MVRFTNSLIGILNFITFLLSIPILILGIWLPRNAETACDRFLDKPLLAIGVLLLLVSIAGLIGACCKVTWLLWIYLFSMFVLIAIALGITVFAFVVTNKGAGDAVSGKGFRDYKLGNYSVWLQNRVNKGKNWDKIKSCLIDSQVCLDLQKQFKNTPQKDLAMANLNPIQSGCCMPPNNCGFVYVSPTNWTKIPGARHDEDCDLWDNKTEKLCFDCQSCKAGLLEKIRASWKKVATVNIVFIAFLIITYSVGCCAFRNNRQDNSPYLY